ncbi:hypothetical protein BC628DRAFT_836618 [Trametes gibbosa]|nr:hypothetical protein BC628DRAFT_836618 [Trametes gibbosa]
MKSPAILSGVLALFLSSRTSATALDTHTRFACPNEVLAAEWFIGKDQNVRLAYSRCDGDGRSIVSAQGAVVPLPLPLTKRQGGMPNVCGATCDTFCFSPAGGGPNEGDCNIIADALLFESENTGDFFNASAAGSASAKITLQYKSCTTYFLNQSPAQLTYCRSDWSKLTTFIAPHCDAAHDAHGGLCVADDQRWFVQVQHT